MAAARVTKAGPPPLLLALALGLLGGCDGSDAPDDALGQVRAPEIARIVPAEEALANAHVPTLDPAPMNDAEIRKALGAGPRCEFRYTSAGRPVLAVAERPAGPPLGGVVKLNGHLVPLEAAAAAEGAAGPAAVLLLVAGPIRMTVVPDPGEGAAGDAGVRRREAEVTFEVGEELKAGYRGYLGCGPDPATDAPRR